MFCIRQPVTSTHRKRQGWQGSSLHPTEQRARFKHPDLNYSWLRACWAARLSESSCHVLCTNKRADSVLQAIQDTFVTTRDEKSTHTGTENQME